MKYEKQDKKMFEHLHESQKGDWLVDYLNRLTQHMCDVRNLDDTIEPETAKYAADVIEEFLIDKIENRSETPEESVIGRMSQDME